MPAWIGAAAAVVGLIAQIGGMIGQGEKAGQQQRLNMATQKPQGGGTNPLTPTAQQFAAPPAPPSSPLLMRPGVEAPMRVPMQTPTSAPMIAPMGMNLPPAMTPDTGPQPSTLPPRLRETAFPAQQRPQEPASAKTTAPDTSSASSGTAMLQNAQMAVNIGQSLGQMLQMFQGQGGPPPMSRPQGPSAPPMPPTAQQFAAQPRMQQMLAQQSPGGNPLLQQQLQQQRFRQLYGGRY